MRINEIFCSIQGEGVYIGLPMIFIRVTGCNLRCIWCDSKYAYEEGSELSISEIINRLKKYPVMRVCITGGEPLAQNDTIDLINKIINENYTVYLETNGSINLDKLPKSDSLRISLDIKCPSSGEEDKMVFSNLQFLRAGDQVKFIIMNNSDYEYAKGILKKYLQNPNYEVIFTPCDATYSDNRTENGSSQFNLKKLTELVLNDGLNVRVLPQLHKIIWPDKQRGK